MMTPTGDGPRGSVIPMVTARGMTRRGTEVDSADERSSDAGGMGAA